MLLSSTHPRWFAASTADLPALLSDHLHCERKAAENALSLVRRYPHRGDVGREARAAGPRGDQPRRAGGRAAGAARVDAARRHAQPLRARRCSPRSAGEEPERLFDALLVAAFIEARSHERLGLLARGFARQRRRRAGRLLRGARDGAEERHAEIFIELARPLLPAADGDGAHRRSWPERETEILAGAAAREPDSLRPQTPLLYPLPATRGEDKRLPRGAEGEPPPTIVAVTSMFADQSVRSAVWPTAMRPVSARPIAGGRARCWPSRARPRGARRRGSPSRARRDRASASSRPACRRRAARSDRRRSPRRPPSA